MKMDKIKFAQLASMLSVIAGRSFSAEDLREIDVLISNAGVGRSDPFVVNTLMQHVRSGASKIEAIKAYRTLTGLGLRESKDAVEANWPALSEHAA
jgi:ribosomal protein L7/L12